MGFHLPICFLTDDLLLLAKASYEQAKIHNSMLDVYCRSSGDKVNKTENQVFFSKNVTQMEAKNIG